MSGPASDGEEMLREVSDGLTRPVKELFPKYFYDHRGSELFEEITRLPEYYPTRTERSLLEDRGRRWVVELRPATLVELGAGSARKTRVLLDAMIEEGCGELFVPVDVSGSFLEETAREVCAEFPGLEVVPEVADISRSFALSAGLVRPVLHALLGGTLGNFYPDEAVALLRRVASHMEPDDRFLLGVDLRPGERKGRETLEAAYNDAAGVTAEFNTNILRVLNRELGTDFDPDAFEHRARYNGEEGRIEMNLVARRPQVVSVPHGPTVHLAEGEAIRTEVSYKYDRETVEARFARAGLEVARWETDEREHFALVLGRLRTE